MCVCKIELNLLLALILCIYIGFVTCNREEVCRKRMKFLKKELNRVKREKEAEISVSDLEVADLSG